MKKNSIKRIIVIILCAAILLGGIIALPFTISARVSPKSEYTIVIDAGHGGRDGGCEGSRSIEKELNLEYSYAIKRMLEDYGVRVVMTRKNDSGLYSPFSKNKKLDDMKKRVALINKAKPDLFISVHMNSTVYTYRKGAGVYYAINNPKSQEFAQVLTQTYVKHLENAEPSPKVGDYYILQEPAYSGVLIECGFLSNAEEEALLLSNAYKQKVAYATFCAVLLFLGLRSG